MISDHIMTVTAFELRKIARQVPLGFECKSCGRSAFNWLSRISRFLENGETCCADMKDWCKRAENGEPEPTPLQCHGQSEVWK